MSNFKLSLPDEDEWLTDLETEDDYKDREVYNRSMTPPSPSLLEIEDDNDEEILPPPAKKRSITRNPFTDDDDEEEIKFAPVKREPPSFAPVKREPPDPLIQKLQNIPMNTLSTESIIEAQSLIIQYLKVIIPCMFLDYDFKKELIFSL